MIAVIDPDCTLRAKAGVVRFVEGNGLRAQISETGGESLLAVIGDVPAGFADRLGNKTAPFEIGDRRSCFNLPFQLRRNGRIRGQVVDREGEVGRRLAHVAL